ncbi:MAG: 50S ribosomal protein L13 [Candidatus Krumholzibacteriota bacterium]|nr:50S ribosomal protein L13 [Candidatus Krumholzibacteriota bacterium]
MQKTTILKPGEFERNWYIVDAGGKTLGRLAARIASVLRGKYKPGYAPHMDVGDFVVVVNASKVFVSGKKKEDKMYWRYTGYHGGLHLTNLKHAMEKDPTFPLRNAVKGMLPHNRLGRRLLKKLKIYPEAAHPHAAQKPEPLEL